MIGLSQLGQRVLGDASVRNVGDLMDDGRAEDVAHPIDVVQNAGNQLGEEHQVRPVGRLIGRQSHNVAVTASISWKIPNSNI